MQEFPQYRVGRIYLLVKQHLQFFKQPHTHADVMKTMYDIRNELAREEQENLQLPQKRKRT